MRKTTLVIALIGLTLSINAQDQTINGATFKQNGRVGIGVTNPSSKLEIKSDVNNNSEIHINTTSNGRKSIIRFQDAGETTWGFLSNYPSSGKFSLYNYQNNSNALILNANGHVGIGTTNPTQKLEVNGNIYLPIQSNASGALLFRAHSDDISSIKAERFGSGTGTRLSFQMSDDQDDYFSFNHKHWSLGNIEVLKIQRTGLYVNGRLENNGTIRSKEVTVEATSWPDYVFEKEYDLKPLADVENYILRNGHLPNIPAAKEVLDNGITLGAMNVKLLEKVEELTLYIIQMNKELETLKKEIKSNKQQQN